MKELSVHSGLNETLVYILSGSGVRDKDLFGTNGKADEGIHSNSNNCSKIKTSDESNFL